jgi:hypothetical protein
MYIYDSRFQGLGEAAAIEPFAEQAYGPQMVRDPDRTKDMTDAIDAVKRTLSLKDQKRLEQVALLSQSWEPAKTL